MNDIILNNGEIPITRVLDGDEYKIELFKKLNEEYNEVISSNQKEELLEECADMLEVLLAILELNGYTLDDLINVRESKKEKRGGFSKRLYLSGVKQEKRN